MMAETITAIREVHNVEQGSVGAGGGFMNLVGALFGGSKYDGYEVVTTEQTIQILIDNGQSCCEEWGYLASDDNLNQFVGASLLDLTVVDEGLNERMVGRSDDLEDGGIVFVNLKTDRGVLQLACYNAHNGYYGHEVHIISREMTVARGV